MFNFFGELKNKCKILENKINGYQCVMIDDSMLYVEGFRGILTFSEDCISFRVFRGVITVEGKGLMVKEMSQSTITIIGKILRYEKV